MRSRRSILRDAFRPVGIYRKPIIPILPYQSAILQDRDLYHLGGVYYGVDTGWAVYEMILKPQGPRRDEYPLGGIPIGISQSYLFYLSYHINPIYPILPILYPTG